MVEYGLIVGVISLMSLSAVTLLGDTTGESFDAVTEALDNSANGEAAESSGGESSQGGGGDTGSGATTTTTAPPTTTTTMPPTTTTTAPPAPTTTTAPDPQGTVEAGSTSATVDSWKRNRGDWTASVEYSNEFGQDQYLTLVVTATDDKGRTTTTTVHGFVVPAGGTATFDHGGNDLRKKRSGYTGVLEVEIEVVSITTTDGNSQEVTYQVDDQVSTVSAPTP